jgi:hypothetical protein
MLLRHIWLAPMVKPATISEDEEAEKAAEAGDSMNPAGTIEQSQSAEHDPEVAEWVKNALERKRNGQLSFAKKPALHEAPLDAVPGSPLMTKDEAPAKAEEPEVAKDEPTHEPLHPNPGVRVSSPELVSAHIETVDFASNLSPEEEKKSGGAE